MYLSDSGLGVLDPFTAISAVGIVKNLFGIGKKKRALKQIEANAAGKFTSKFPEYADWAEFLSRPATNPKAKAAGAKTFADEYNFWRKRKDSILIKNQIATPEDYIAWLVMEHGIKGGTIKPSAKPGDPLYFNSPFVIGTRIPIFDYETVVKWAQEEQARLQPAPTPVQLTPQNVRVPPKIEFQPPPQATPTPAPNNLLAPNYSATGAFLPQQPQSAPPAPTQTGSLILPLALIAGAGVLFLATQRKGRR